MNTQEIYQTAYNQLTALNRAAQSAGGEFFRLEDATFGDDYLQVTFHQNAFRIYKYFIRYDEASDTYDVRFGYLNRMTYEFMVSEWEHNVYVSNLLLVLVGFWNERNSTVFHDIALEVSEQEAVKETAEETKTQTSDEPSAAFKQAQGLVEDYDTIHVRYAMIPSVQQSEKLQDIEFETQVGLIFFDTDRNQWMLEARFTRVMDIKLKETQAIAKFFTEASKLLTELTRIADRPKLLIAAHYIYLQEMHKFRAYKRIRNDLKLGLAEAKYLLDEALQNQTLHTNHVMAAMNALQVVSIDKAVQQLMFNSMLSRNEAEAIVKEAEEIIWMLPN